MIDLEADARRLAAETKRRRALTGAVLSIIAAGVQLKCAGLPTSDPLLVELRAFLRRLNELRGGGR